MVACAGLDDMHQKGRSEARAIIKFWLLHRETAVAAVLMLQDLCCCPNIGMQRNVTLCAAQQLNVQPLSLTSCFELLFRDIVKEI